MKNIYIYLDDSGVLHRNEKTGYFVYAGYAFFAHEKDHAKRQYKSLVNKIKGETGMNGEVKAFTLQDKKHKNALYKVLRKYTSIGLCVKIDKCKDYILDDKSSIHRYKDYIVKRLIKDLFTKLINQGRINKEEDIHLHLYLDEQATKSNGIYGLKASIYEELKNGVTNWNYGIEFPPILSGNFVVEVEYCDSKNNYLIQASDILANRIWVSYAHDNLSMRQIPNHIHRSFP